jgi:hypothetical protein
MNVFAIGTGRSGTKTFYEACKHITNFTVGHETRVSETGPDRIFYPDRHIEVDHRLTFFKGQLVYAHNPAYTHFVHVTRNHLDIEASWLKRTKIKGSMINTWPQAAFFRPDPLTHPSAYAQHYVRATLADIEFFMWAYGSKYGGDKIHTIRIDDEFSGEASFRRFWRLIGAQGDMVAALETLKERHNAS